MRFSVLYIASFILFFSQSFAGLPPTTIKGQAAAGTAPTTFNLQVPGNQSTRIDSTTALIETGNNNVLLNPSFEASTVDSGWTVAGFPVVAIVSPITSKVFQGKQALGIQLTRSSYSSTKLLSQAFTATQDWSGSTVVGTIKISTDLPAQVTGSVCIAKDSVEQQCVSILQQATWLQSYEVSAIGATVGTVYEIYVKVESSASLSVDPSLIFDDVKLGPNNIGFQAPPQTFTASVDQAGVVTNQEPIPWIASVGVTDVSLYTATYLPGITTSAMNCGADPITNSNRTVSVLTTTATGFTARAEVPASPTPVKAAGAFKITCDLVGAAATKAVIAASNLDTTWARYTPVFSGLGTPTNVNCFAKFDGTDQMIDCKFTCTGAASEARVGLAFGATSGDTDILPPGTSRASYGPIAYDTGAANVIGPLKEPNVTYITFGNQVATQAGLTKLNGSQVCGGSTVSFQARVPIKGRGPSQGAMVGPGQVYTNQKTAQMRISKIFFYGSTNAAACLTNGLCNSSLSTDDISVSRTATGLYDVDFVPPFGSIPTCHYTLGTTSFVAMRTMIQDVATSTTSKVKIRISGTSDNTTQDGQGILTCFGNW